MKYTKERLAPIAAESLSIADVMRGLDLKLSGGSYAHIGKLLKRFTIDTSHFHGKTRNRGPNRKGGSPKKSWQEVLVRSPEGSPRVEAFKLRRALIESGRPYLCEKCKTEPVWHGQELRIEVEHSDGDFCNNQPENLKFLCPNCHQVFGWKRGPILCGVTSVAEYDRVARKRRRDALVAEQVGASA